MPGGSCPPLFQRKGVRNKIRLVDPPLPLPSTRRGKARLQKMPRVPSLFLALSLPFSPPPLFFTINAHSMLCRSKIGIKFKGC